MCIFDCLDKIIILIFNCYVNDYFNLLILVIKDLKLVCIILINIRILYDKKERLIFYILYIFIIVLSW